MSRSDCKWVLRNFLLKEGGSLSPCCVLSGPATEARAPRAGLDEPVAVQHQGPEARGGPPPVVAALHQRHGSARGCAALAKGSTLRRWPAVFPCCRDPIMRRG